MLAAGADLVWLALNHGIGLAMAARRPPIPTDDVVGRPRYPRYQTQDCTDAQADNNFGDEFFNEACHCSYSRFGVVSVKITAISQSF
jgi:hypothetical protein